MTAALPATVYPVPKGWQAFSLNEIRSPEPYSCVAGPFGSSIGSRFFAESGVPVIRGSNLRQDLTRFVPEGFAFLSETKAQDFVPQHVVAGDLVFTCWGTVGQVGLIPADGPYPAYIISNKQLKLRVDRSKAEPLFCFYYFASPRYVEHIQNRGIGGAVPGINLGILKSLRIALPPLHAQRKILAVLTTYDDLIENNRRRMALLEESARLLYREWFVRLRFPGHEHTRIVDGVPDGWERNGLKEVTSFLKRGITPAYDDEADGVVINQKCIRDGRVNLQLARHQSKEVAPERLLKLGDVLVNSTGEGTLGRVAQVKAPLSNCTVDTHVTIVRPKECVARHYFGLAVMEWETRFATMGKGATNQTELSPGTIGETEIVMPSHTLLGQFELFAEPLYEQITNLGAQNEKLRAARDLLLPRLMSGEIAV